MNHTGLHIDAQRHDAAGGERFDVLDPVIEEGVASVDSADIADADAALAAVASGAWAAKGPRERSGVPCGAWAPVTARPDGGGVAT